jgi:hypothetical protein
MNHRGQQKQQKKQPKKKKKKNAPGDVREMLEVHLRVCDEDQIAYDNLVEEHGEHHIMVRFN